mmetsp:Transcript_2312/g.4768  ORF Transcript_2312/g.4768 Transcript_2312/m.4768 type:complete len:343 (+) Transcript_2312:2106-3134(+)
MPPSRHKLAGVPVTVRPHQHTIPEWHPVDDLAGIRRAIRLRPPPHACSKFEAGWRTPSFRHLRCECTEEGARLCLQHDHAVVCAKAPHIEVIAGCACPVGRQQLNCLAPHLLSTLAVFEQVHATLSQVEKSALVPLPISPFTQVARPITASEHAIAVWVTPRYLAAVCRVILVYVHAIPSRHALLQLSNNIQLSCVCYIFPLLFILQYLRHCLPDIHSPIFKHREVVAGRNGHSAIVSLPQHGSKVFNRAISMGYVELPRAFVIELARSAYSYARSYASTRHERANVGRELHIFVFFWPNIGCALHERLRTRPLSLQLNMGEHLFPSHHINCIIYLHTVQAL